MGPISLCSTHQGREAVPQACDTCRRINVERDVVTKTVDAFTGRRIRPCDGRGGPQVLRRR
jgi:hypothetical protein